jgi:biopolymer transport protein ExbB
MKMAGGIGEALVCTASGLVVAIPAYVLHRYFRSRVRGYVVQMEKQATALLDELSVARLAPVETRPAAAASSAPPRPARVVS